MQTQVTKEGNLIDSRKSLNEVDIFNATMRQELWAVRKGILEKIVTTIESEEILFRCISNEIGVGDKQVKELGNSFLPFRIVPHSCFLLLINIL